MRALLLLLIASTAGAEPWQAVDQTKGVETELHASDVPVDEIATALLEGPVIVKRHAARVTGEVVAPSTPGAVAAAFAAAGVPLPSSFVVARSPATTVDLQLVDVAPEEVFRIIADTLHANVIVKGGPLPRVAMRLHHVPSDRALELLAPVVGLVPSRTGNTYYLLPTGEKLPALTAQPARVVSLDARNAPAKLAAAALAAVTKSKPATCSDAVTTVRIKRVPLAEAVRALEVETGALAPGSCALAPSTQVDLDKLKLVAIATSGTVRIAAGTVDGAPVLVEAGDGLDIGDAYVAKGGKSAMLYSFELDQPQVDTYATWRARFTRTAMVVRRHGTWAAWLGRADGGFEQLQHPPTGVGIAIDARGVTATYDGKSELIPLRR